MVAVVDATNKCYLGGSVPLEYRHCGPRLRLQGNVGDHDDSSLGLLVSGCLPAKPMNVPSSARFLLRHVLIDADNPSWAPLGSSTATDEVFHCLSIRLH